MGYKKRPKEVNVNVQVKVEGSKMDFMDPPGQRTGIRTVASKPAEAHNGLMGSKANDRQVGGQHYQNGAGPCPHCGKPIQHWDLAAMFGWDYFQGQITKYVMRWRSKNGLQDLEKGGHVLQKYLETERRRLEDERGAEPSAHGYVYQDRGGEKVSGGQVASSGAGQSHTE